MRPDFPGASRAACVSPPSPAASGTAASARCSRAERLQPIAIDKREARFDTPDDLLLLDRQSGAQERNHARRHRRHEGRQHRRRQTLAALASLSEALPFLIDLGADERRSMAKFGDKNGSFVVKALAIAENQPRNPAAQPQRGMSFL